MTPSLTLTRDELRALTGYKQIPKMCEWLTQRGWVFEPGSGRGKIPAVDRTYYLARMSGQLKTPRRINPRFDLM